MRKRTSHLANTWLVGELSAQQLFAGLEGEQVGLAVDLSRRTSQLTKDINACTAGYQGGDVTEQQGDRDLLVEIVSLDHQHRLVRRHDELMPFEVVVLLSMASAREIEGLNAQQILARLPKLDRDFFTVQGSFLISNEETLIEDTQAALLQALKRSPDGDFIPLALSVLEHVETQGRNDPPAWTGIIANLLADTVLECHVQGEECRLREVSPDFATGFVKAVHDTIQGYRNYVAQLE